jgi:DNA-binding beta-propeller fold protein YncE
MSRQSTNKARRIVKNLIPGQVIPVGSQPWGVAVDDINHTAYIANSGETTITPINTDSLAPGQKINLSYKPDRLLLNKVNSTLYALSIDGYITPINTKSNTPGTNISVGFDPESADIDERNNILFVANYFASQIHCIDMTTGKPTPGSPIYLSVKPGDIVVDETNDTLYVLYGEEDPQGYVLPLSATPPYAPKGNPIPIGFAPWAMVLDKTNQLLYVGINNDEISIVYTSDNTSSIDSLNVPKSPGGSISCMAVDEAYQILYVVYQDNVFKSSLYAIKTDTNYASPPAYVGDLVDGVAVDQKTHTIWTTSVKDNTTTPVQINFAKVVISAPQAGGHVPPGQVLLSGSGEPGAMIRIRLIARESAVAMNLPPVIVGRDGLWRTTARIATPGKYSMVALQYVGSVPTLQCTMNFTVA